MTDKDRKGIILIVAVICAVVGLLGLKFSLGQGIKADSRNCIGAPVRNTVILIDKSDAVASQTQAEIEERIMTHIADSVETNELVSVFTVSQLSKNNLKPVLSLCRPPHEGKITHEDVKGIKAKYQKSFVDPIRRVLVAGAESSPESPIAQAITDLTLSNYLRAEVNTLLIFSDMVEHVPGKYSMFNCSNPNDAIQVYKQSIYGGKKQPEFKNTKIFVNIIPRDDLRRAAVECRDKFWPWFFASNNGTAGQQHRGVVIDYLPGGIIKKTSS